MQKRKMTDDRVANGVVGALIVLCIVAMGTSLQADEIHVGSSNLDGTPSSSVQIHGKGQGFVAVMAQPGKNPTIIAIRGTNK